MAQLPPIPHRGLVDRTLHALFVFHPQIGIYAVFQPGEYRSGGFQFMERAARALGVADPVTQWQRPAVPHMVDATVPRLAHFVELAVMVDFASAALAFDEVVISDVFARHADLMRALGGAFALALLGRDPPLSR